MSPTGKNVTEVAEVGLLANIYFDGAVQSRTIVTREGVRKTLGVYLPGNYTFESHEPESVEITRGEVEVLMPGDNDWKKVAPGEIYDVPPDCRFQVRCGEIAEYVCEFR